jgi:hypothetical protein
MISMTDSLVVDRSLILWYGRGRLLSGKMLYECRRPEAVVRCFQAAVQGRATCGVVRLNIRGNSYRLKEKLKAGLVRAEETKDS